MLYYTHARQQEQKRKTKTGGVVKNGSRDFIYHPHGRPGISAF